MTRLSENQAQTSDAFGFKWEKRETYEAPHVQEAGAKWLIERYCGGDPAVLTQWLAGGRKKILDAGCGSAYSAVLLFGDHLKNHDYVGVDISKAVETARARFAERGYPGTFIQSDLRKIPVEDGSFDLIFSEGVLHHTDDTGESLELLSRKLKRGGRFLFYVYRKKSAIREFADDHIRAAIRGMSDAEAWEALKPLTELGIALGKLNVELDVPSDIPLLGIKKGKQDLQRFFYWEIAKAYYRPEYSFDEMHVVNFDWYRPANCHRHTIEEVREFCRRSGLRIDMLNEQEAGFTVVATRLPERA